MTEPTAEQLRIIEATDRIRIVQAVPGSGKTWLIGQVIKKELETWNHPGGIAALSFTRVAGQEIHRAIGYELGLPHFIGTLDSFLYRFIVQPFFTQVCPDYAEPHLVAAERGIEHWDKGPNTILRKDGIHLLQLAYNNSDQESLRISYRDQMNYNKITSPSSEENQWIRQGKHELIKSFGWLTHEDITLYAYYIILHKDFGPLIRNLISKRFPFIIIDELQDVNSFTGKVILQLLTEINIKALLLGDPYQAIYAFNQSLFNVFTPARELEGAQLFTIETSQRCPSNITSIVHQFMAEPHIKCNSQSKGQNRLIAYSEFENEVPDFIQRINLKASNARFITRKNSTIHKLRKNFSQEQTKLDCPPLNHMTYAVQEFFRGHYTKSLELAKACVSRWLFGQDEIHTIINKLSEKEKIQLGTVIRSSLLKCASMSQDMSLYQWQSNAGEQIESTYRASDLCLKTENLQSLRPNSSDKGNILIKQLFSIPDSSLESISLNTIHSVKGETHDTTVIICPPPLTPSQCPSEIWWSQNDWNQEERHIAYVAFTRSRKDLYLIVSQETAQRLKEKRPGFFELFTKDSP